MLTTPYAFFRRFTSFLAFPNLFEFETLFRELSRSRMNSHSYKPTFISFVPPFLRVDMSFSFSCCDYPFHKTRIYIYIYKCNIVVIYFPIMFLFSRFFFLVTYHRISYHLISLLFEFCFVFYIRMQCIKFMSGFL